MILYAERLLYRNYVDEDEEGAFKWVLKSIEDEEEASDEGYVLYDGKVIQKDVKKAENDFKKAAKYDKKWILWHVKLMMDKDIDEVLFDRDEAVYYSKRGAEKDYYYWEPLLN